MKDKDEYIWSDYTPEYISQLQEIKANDKQEFLLSEKALTGDGEVLSLHQNLHDNWKELYATAFYEQPVSVLECGCGGCYHLKNLRIVLPKAEIHGIDLLQSQIDFGKTFSNLPVDIAENVMVMDMTKERPKRQYEFVFSMAVVMHLSTENAIAFLKNMRDTSSKYVFMVEGIKNHKNWFDLVQSVFNEDEWKFSLIEQYIPNGILLTRKW